MALLAALLALVSPPAALADSSDSAARPTQHAQLGAGFYYSCALLAAGEVRCWGQGLYGQLGHASTVYLGDDETPASAGDVPVGGRSTAISAGAFHVCALLVGGGVRCWGMGQYGQLGHGEAQNIGDDETPASVGDIQLGGTATAISAGGLHTCALLTTGSVRCWGYGGYGQLGYGATTNVGSAPGSTPAVAGDVDLGGTAAAVSAGGEHTCALMTTGAVRCWGQGDYGQLGYGNTASVGDGSGLSPASAGDVDLGEKAVAISAGGRHTCALLASGAVRCWGYGATGALGYGDTASVGDDETPAAAGDVPLGGTAVSISASGSHTCAVLTTGAVRCWGSGDDGRLGHGSTENVGDDETPASAGDVPLGGTAVAVATGDRHTCASFSTGAVRCWGFGEAGQLGLVGTNDIGDDETPASVDEISVGGALARLHSDVSLAWASVPTLARGATSSTTLTVSETGPDDATDLAVVVRAPGVVDLGSVVASQGTYQPTTGIWRIATLRGTATLSVPFTAAQPGGDTFGADAVTTSVDPDQTDGAYLAAHATTPVRVDGIAGPPGPSVTPIIAVLSSPSLRSAPRKRLRVAYVATTTAPLVLEVDRGSRSVARTTVSPRAAGRNAVTLKAPAVAGRYRLRLVHGSTPLDQSVLVVTRPRRR